MRSAFDIIDPVTNGDISDALCGGERYCDICSLYGVCESRLEIIQCSRCGSQRIETEHFGGICIDCLKSAINAQSVLEYVDEHSYWQEFLESYFDFQIHRLSDRAKKAMREMVLREWAHDMLVKERSCLEKLTAFIGEDDATWEDWASWLNERSNKQ